jgi:hypothetical protein
MESSVINRMIGPDPDKPEKIATKALNWGFGIFGLSGLGWGAMNLPAASRGELNPADFAISTAHSL